MTIQEIKALSQTISANISEVVIGKPSSIRYAVIALLAEGHILIEDVPGTAKTLLAKALAASVGGVFKRVQFTPDLLPSDITGINVFNMKTSEFEFMPGPIYANIVLADEINRATPKTQAGLLECMEERQATVDGETRVLPCPFMVIATQNPVESQGVFPLPEAQLDRFAVKIPMSYTSREDAVEIMVRHKRGNVLDGLKPVTTPEEVSLARALVPEIEVHGDLMDYIVRLAEATRRHDGVSLGVSPRGALCLMRVAQTIAATEGRGYVLPDDVKQAAAPVFAHRLILKGSERVKRDAAENIIKQILETTEVPTEIL
jgi:MoxR-like ATPase